MLVGRNPIREALKAARPMEKLLVMKGDLSSSAREIVRMAKDQGVVVQEVEKARLDSVYPNHQGLLAYMSSASYSTMDEIFRHIEENGEDAFLIILDGITDPHNLGAIIRSAECAGAHGVIVSERRSAGLNPACVKAAAGAVEYMRVARVTNISRAIEEIKERGIWVYAADMDGENVNDMNLTGPIAIVIGAEGEGVSQLVRKTCDGAVSIPLKGHINSLNASVAAGIIMFRISAAR
ncbi:MAG: 23S rRNA (guanosine(2251)-2'-O)-methyltransferase RlmB [Clostridia bacterium]|nr:23S rRNA (guanosine(2251)-2'-O)-methyltransferase RlmB [Clostridia bacterium]